jgi:hypothetical protein
VRRARVALLLAGALCACGVPAAAQTAARPQRLPSLELGGGVTWAGSFTGPSRAAELTRNEQAAGGFDLFRFSGEVTNGPGLGAWIGYHVTRTIAVEGGFRFSKPELAYRLSGDAENAPDATATETLSRYAITGSVVLHLRRVDGRRFVPFVAAGGGYIRDLHELHELLETGHEYHGLAGIKYWLGSGRRRFGIRAQAGVTVTSGGFDFRDDSRTVPIAAAGVVYLF